MKVGILTYHRSYNYGAFLQAYALVKKLIDEGIDAELIDFNMKASKKIYQLSYRRPRIALFRYKQYKMFEQHISIMLRSKIFLFSDNSKEFIEVFRGKYEIIIVGSDEIWKVDGVRGFPNPYWLPGDLKCIKLSYAASSRCDFSELSKEKQDMLKSFINEFDYLGVRDVYTLNQISNFANESLKEKIVICCDPTFAYDFKANKDRGKRILFEKFGIDLTKKCIGIMMSDVKMIQALRTKIKDIQLVSLYSFNSQTKNVADLTPFEWIDVISALDFMITSFFHGMCFAIQCNTPFIAIDCGSSNNEQSKMYDLLLREGLLEQYIFKKESSNTYIEDTINAYQKSLNEEEYDFSSVVESQKALFDPFLMYLKSVMNRNIKIVKD